MEEEKVEVYISIDKVLNGQKISIKPVNNFMSVEEAIKFLQEFLTNK